MSKQTNETNSQPGSSELVQMLANAMNLTQHSGEPILLPNILIPEHWLPAKMEGKTSLPIAERVLRWFLQNGFYGDRTRKNIHGYPGLFRELFEPPPWIEVEPEDCEGDLPEERARELRPLYLHCWEHGYDLVEIYRDYLDVQQNEYEISETLRDLKLSEILSKLKPGLLLDLCIKINLVRILGRDTVESLYDAVFDFEEFSAAVGAPDLFLWHPDSAHQLWFFAEVKGSRDHLRKSQYEWIQNHWDRMQGRMMLLTIVRPTEGTFTD